MSQSHAALRDEIRQALSELFAESQLARRSGASLESVVSTHGSDRVVQIAVPQAGDITITIGPAEVLLSRPSSPPPPGSGRGHRDECPVGCINPCGTPPFAGEPSEAPYFSEAEEELIARLETTLSISREQLLGDLMHSLLSSALARLAADHGLT